MTTSGRTDVTSVEALEIHTKAIEADPDNHDMISCWCCCIDCDFDYQTVIANDKAAGIRSAFALSDEAGGDTQKDTAGPVSDINRTSPR